MLLLAASARELFSNECSHHLGREKVHINVSHNSKSMIRMKGSLCSCWLDYWHCCNTCCRFGYSLTQVVGAHTVQMTN